jgi:hypothetical protein
MPLTKVSSGVIAANAVVDSFGTQSITGDKLGLTAINANNIVGGSITGAKLAANTVSGDVIGQNAISSNNIVSVNASVATVGTLPKARLPAGSVLQVVSNTKTDGFSTTSDSMVDATGLFVTITPTSATSKILISVNLSMTPGSSGVVMFYQIVRNSTAIGIGTTGGANFNVTGAMYSSDASSNQNFIYPNSQFLDSPATTSATTYKIQVCNNTSGTSVFLNKRSDTYISAISTITAMEIAA